MAKIIISRLLQGVVVIFFIVSLTFFLVRAMPGNPFEFDSDGKRLAEHIIKANKEYYELDKPLVIQYTSFLKKTFIEGDLGPSMSKQGRQVSTILGGAFPNSALLGLVAILIALAIGIPVGAFAAFLKNSWMDYSSMAFAMIGICIPAFVIGPVLAMLLSTKLGIFNLAGWEQAKDIILPAFTLGLATAAYIARLTRAGMLDILSSDYIRTAKAKGLETSKIIIRHALRGGIIPAITYVGPAFAALISGSFVVETIFQVPGMGQHFINAALARDYNMLQGLVLLFGILIVIANLFSDILLVVLNPKLRT